MAVKRKTAKSKVAIVEAIPIDTKPAQSRLFSKQVLIGVIVVGLGLLVFYKKHWFVPATVNGMPILSPEVVTRLYSDYRAQAVSELIDEKIITAEARKNNAEPKSEEVNAKMAELEVQVGGAENLNNLLKQEGTSRASLERRMKMRLALEKIYSNEATVSAQEIDEFVKTNKAQLIATDSAAQRTEAESIIKQNKLGTIINEKFTQLREAANIKTF